MKIVCVHVRVGDCAYGYGSARAIAVRVAVMVVVTSAILPAVVEIMVTVTDTGCRSPSLGFQT